MKKLVRYVGKSLSGMAFLECASFRHVWRVIRLVQTVRVRIHEAETWAVTQHKHSLTLFPPVVCTLLTTDDVIKNGRSGLGPTNIE